MRMDSRSMVKRKEQAWYSTYPRGYVDFQKDVAAIRTGFVNPYLMTSISSREGLVFKPIYYDTQLTVYPSLYNSISGRDRTNRCHSPGDSWKNRKLFGQRMIWRVVHWKWSRKQFWPQVFQEAPRRLILSSVSDSDKAELPLLGMTYPREDEGRFLRFSGQWS